MLVLERSACRQFLFILIWDGGFPFAIGAHPAEHNAPAYRLSSGVIAAMLRVRSLVVLSMLHG